MSRGLGKLQRDILAYLEAIECGTTVPQLAFLLANDWADGPFSADTCQWAKRSQEVSVRRAVHNLAERGMVEAVAGRSMTPDRRRVINVLGVRLPSQAWPDWFDAPERIAEKQAKWAAYFR